MRLFIFLLLLVIAVISCGKQARLPDEAFMEELLRDNPDSLAFLLEEEINPSVLSEKEKNDYIWWLTRTRGKQGRSLINDSLIQMILEHDKLTGAPRLLSTYLLAADQAKSAGDIAREELLLNQALSLAKEKQDSTRVVSLCYRLGYLHENGNSELATLIQTIQRYTRNRDADYYLNMVRLYSKLDQPDSIPKYIPMGVAAAVEENKPRQEYLLTRAYAEYLNQTGQAGEALSILRDIERRMPIGEGVVGNEIKFNYISTWMALEQYDSARVYMDYFIPLLAHMKTSNSSSEAYVVESILGLFKTVIRVKQGATFSTNDIASSVNRLVERSRESMKAENERLYAQNKLQKDKLNLEIEKGKLKQQLLGWIVIILVMIAVIIYLYQRKIVRKERGLQKLKEELRSKSIQVVENESIINRNEQLIDSLTSQVEESDDILKELKSLIDENRRIKEKNRTLQEDIQHYSNLTSEKDKALGYFKELSIQNGKLMERDRFLTAQLVKKTEILNELNTNPKYIHDSRWVDIVHGVDQLFDGFSVRLHIDYPTLTDEDIRYCCLFKIRLTNSVISSLMGISPSSVTKRKQRIKEKINQYSTEESMAGESLETYLWNYT